MESTLKLHDSVPKFVDSMQLKSFCHISLTLKLLQYGKLSVPVSVAVGDARCGAGPKQEC